MLYNALLPSLAFSTAVIALPHVRTRSEQWTIPSMSAHFMGRDTGLPFAWGSSGFNSTLDFTVKFPDATSASCSGSWPYTEVPTTPFSCSVDGVSFQLSPTAAGEMSETAFTLTIQRSISQSSTSTSGSHEVYANDAGSENGFLTCLGGPPLDGLRCSLSGWASTAGPLSITAENVVV